MSEARAGLQRLCAQCGIATGYHDIWGNWREVPEASLRALLAGFGIDAGSPGRAAQAEFELRAARWRDALEPVLAVPEQRAPWRVRIRTAAGARALRWRLDAEDGARHEGACDAASLRETGREEIGGALRCERELEIGVALPPGYHRLRLWDEGAPAGEALVVAAPERCYRPEALAGSGRIWGPSVQLYALRSERNWGIGDFSDLAQLVDDWAALGAGFIGVSPLHALFPGQPARISPYSPSSRRRFNVLHLDVEAIAEFGDCADAQRLVGAPAFQARLADLRAAPLVDYAGVTAAKLEALQCLYAHFRARHLAVASTAALAFRDFQARGGVSLRRHALFEALQAHFHAVDPDVLGWLDWPEACRDPEAGAVAQFAGAHLAQIEFYEYLQWQSERQLDAVGERCAGRRLALGLYLDLAVSVARDGSDAWSEQGAYALGASIGAPPDDFNPQGQDWQLPPLRPDRLRAQGYDALRAALAANMRAAGALRIDHVMGLMRLFWVPRGAGAGAGAYAHYAFDEQLAVVALESHRNRCAVIGEDLGTVSDEVREKLGRAGALSCRLLYFERRDDGEFRPPGEYPHEALVAVGSHDLPPLAGWWQGRDLEQWRDLGIGPAGEAFARRQGERARDRERLARALQREGLLPPQPDAGAVASRPPGPLLAQAVHAFLAASPAQLMTVQLEDVLGVAEQANLPGTTTGHPNWRRKLPASLEALRDDPRVLETARRLAALRPGGGGHG